MRRRLKILGVSAGQGALLFPFLNDKRFKILANLESRGVFHTPKEEQWKLNFGKIPFLRDLNFIFESKKIRGGCDIIVSSPDCGASSVMRLSKVKQLGDPKDNKSLNMVLEAIQFLKPTIFVIENLPKLVTLLPLEFFERSAPEYKLVYHHRPVSDYGNSQVSRKRLMIIGIRKDSKKFKKLFDEVFQVNTLKVSRNLLEVAQFNGNDANWMPPLNKTLAMYDYRKLPEKKVLTVKKIHKLWSNDFKDEKKWPIKTAKMSTLPGVYRLEADRPPLTLRPADRQFRPDGWPLGIQDFKNIMGFPKEYELYMDHERYLYWLNKARYTLAKGACYEAGLWFKRCLEKALKGT